MSNKIADWQTIDYEFSGAHSIASDGDVYVIDNTGKNEVIVLDINLKFKQKFINVGSRPHRTIYDSNTNAFYVIGSPYVWCFKKLNGQLYMDYQKTIPFVQNAYIRSFAIIDGLMYFISGNGNIYAVNYIDGTYSVVAEYPVPFEIVGMNDIAKIGNYFYLTSTQNAIGEVIPKIYRTTDLNNLMTGGYEDINNILGFTSTPYYISQFDGRVYVPEIGAKNGICSFVLVGDSITDIKKEFINDAVSSNSVKRRDMYPL